MTKEKHLPFPPHLMPFLDNMAEVDRLTEIHEEIAGADVGRKTGVEVLNKSAIVLLVACWEAYVEEVATGCFDLLMAHTEDYTVFPNKVLTLASKDLRGHKDETRVWQLAGTGWKNVLKNHKGKILMKYTGPFNTPNSDNIDRLFEGLLGLKSISKEWRWRGMSRKQASSKLDRLIKLRGDIAHKVKTENGVRKTLVNNYSHFLKRLAGQLSNSVAHYIYSWVNLKPWQLVIYVGHKQKGVSGKGTGHL